MELFRLVVTFEEFGKIRKECIVSNNDSFLAMANFNLFVLIVEWFNKNQKDVLSNKPPEVILSTDKEYPEFIDFLGDPTEYNPDVPKKYRSWVSPMFNIGWGKSKIISVEIECGIIMKFEK